MGRTKIRSQPQASDVYVAVMGVTGSGKSTFISHLTDEEVTVGNGLYACTQEVAVYRCKQSGPVNIWLVDTPGFDDTHRSDTDVLREIAAWLTHSFSSQDVILNGMIYLHRIIDIRMQGSALKNLFMFKKLCGRDALKNVILATTMWEQVSPEDGERRERELARTSEFWGEMILRGAQIKRHWNNGESAWELVNIFASKDSTRQKAVLNIQDEMVVQKKPLDKTDAGLELENSLIQEREKWSRELEETREMMREALAAKDKESLELLRETEAKMNKRIEKAQRASEELKVDMQKMHRDHISKFEKELEILTLGTEKRIQGVENALMKGRTGPEGQPPTAAPRELPVISGIGDNLQERDSKTASSQDKTYWFGTSPMLGRFSLSLSGDIYYFQGPRRIYTNLGSDFVSMRGERNHAGLGTNGSWYKHYHVGGVPRTKSSFNLGNVYPGLDKQLQNLNEPRHGCPDIVALGEKGTYFFSTDRGLRQWLPDETWATCVLPQDIKHLWPGKNNSFVLVKTDGKLIYNLKGLYQGLGPQIQIILSEGRSIMALALNLENSRSWAIVWEGGAACCPAGAFHHDRFEQFLKDNFQVIENTIGSSTTGSHLRREP
ncbi:uncharacterized protein BJX67DRAFT_380913 [Aspergillus lucknowensis]|uniref:G domain-containing protein n=1 Tax=Aspergillus lucknowensis TaxID=176173 RepID=A0ABR4LSP2_9EURO